VGSWQAIKRNVPTCACGGRGEGVCLNFAILSFTTCPRFELDGNLGDGILGTGHWFRPARIPETLCHSRFGVCGNRTLSNRLSTSEALAGVNLSDM
jgi:hypothetical protein